MPGVACVVSESPTWTAVPSRLVRASPWGAAPEGLLREAALPPSPRPGPGCLRSCGKGLQPGPAATRLSPGRAPSFSGLVSGAVDRLGRSHLSFPWTGKQARLWSWERMETAFLHVSKPFKGHTAAAPGPLSIGKLTPVEARPYSRQRPARGHCPRPFAGGNPLPPQGSPQMLHDGFCFTSAIFSL